MPRPPVTSRDAILEAAIRVATRDGLLATTLENVAREAGVTKGGVLYHFASKDLLLTGMIEHFGREVERLLVTRIADDPEPDRRWIRAAFESLIAPPGSEEPTTGLRPVELRKFITAMMTAFASKPSLLEAMRPFFARMIGRISAEPDGVDQIVGWLAADGLLLWEMFGIVRPGDPLWQEIVDKLREQTRPRGERESARQRGSRGEPDQRAAKGKR